jgi:tRNA(fMet)-specific endonuclease VapC
VRVRILPFGEAEAVRAGDLLALLESEGVPIGTEDVLIGATALEAGLTVVTRNVKHFDRIPGLTVESWWP